MLSSVVRKIKSTEQRVSVSDICNFLGYCRQSYYKSLLNETKQEVAKSIILESVCKVRKKLPRIGTRKIQHLIQQELIDKGVKCGRDKLFSLMRLHKLLIIPQRQYVQTTFSKHWMHKYPNSIKFLPITAPEQVWVSDITYIKTIDGTSYLTLITDAFSRKIVAYNISKNMTAVECSKALKSAIKSRIYLENNLIHHSDRGLQYCSKEYVETAQKANIKISMTETSSPYDNALAERMNKTIKEEFCLNNKILKREVLNQVIDEAIQLYNEYRPHLSLNYYTPSQIHKNPQLIMLNGE